MSTGNKEKRVINICCGAFNWDERNNELVFVAGQEKPMEQNVDEIVIPLEGEWKTETTKRKTTNNVRTKTGTNKNSTKTNKKANIKEEVNKEEQPKRKPGRPRKTEIAVQEER